MSQISWDGVLQARRSLSQHVYSPDSYPNPNPNPNPKPESHSYRYAVGKVERDGLWGSMSALQRCSLLTSLPAKEQRRPYSILLLSFYPSILLSFYSFIPIRDLVLTLGSYFITRHYWSSQLFYWG